MFRISHSKDAFVVLYIYWCDQTYKVALKNTFYKTKIFFVYNASCLPITLPTIPKEELAAFPRYLLKCRSRHVLMVTHHSWAAKILVVLGFD